MIEVDLQDQDGGIISIGAVDENFWNSYGIQATAYAAQRGIGIFVPGGPPQVGTAERNIYAWGDFTQWVASTSAGVSLRTSGSSGWSTGAIVAAVVAGTAAGGLLVFLLTRKA